MAANRHLSRKDFLLGTLAGLVAAPMASAAGTPPKVSTPGGSVGARSRLVLLGTSGGPIIRKNRSQPSNLLVVDGVPYMFDVGYGCLRQLAMLNFSARDIGAIFISHLHTDHSIDIASILNFGWSAVRKADLPIIGPWGTERLTKAATAYVNEAIHVFVEQSPERGPANFARPQDIAADGVIYKDARITVSAAANTHYQTFEHGQDRSYSFRVECPDRIICFSGDTGPSAALTKLAQSADILVSEVILVDETMDMVKRFAKMSDAETAIVRDHMAREHMPPEDLGRTAQEAGVKLLVLSHIVPGEDTESDMSRYVTGIRRYYPGPIVIGRDLLEL